jgi:hypothetical protein
VRKHHDKPEVDEPADVAAQPRKSALTIDGRPIGNILADKKARKTALDDDQQPRDSFSFRDEFYTAEEFAEAVGITVESLWRWWRRGEGPPWTLLGRKRVIPKSGAHEWLNANQVQPPRKFKLCAAAR